MLFPLLQASLWQVPCIPRPVWAWGTASLLPYPSPPSPSLQFWARPGAASRWAVWVGSNSDPWGWMALLCLSLLASARNDTSQALCISLSFLLHHGCVLLWAFKKFNHIVFTQTGEASSGENGKTLRVNVKKEGWKFKRVVHQKIEIHRLCLSKPVCCYFFLLNTKGEFKKINVYLLQKKSGPFQNGQKRAESTIQ